MVKQSDHSFRPHYCFGSSRKRNRFYFGDNLAALEELCRDKRVAGQVRLIYIDPPYATGTNFVGNKYEQAYSDRFDSDEAFLSFLQERLELLHRLLADNGSIYLHIDCKIGHYVKVLMDRVFGKQNFRNEITRIKCNPKNFARKGYGNIKDVILFYSKTRLPNGQDSIVWNDYRRPLSDDEILRQFPRVDSDGRRYATTPLHARGETINGPTGQPWQGLTPPRGRHWRYPPSELTRLDKAGLIEWSSTGNPRKRIYADENRGRKIQDVWEFKDNGYERSAYPTEKNLSMLEQIILQSSNEGDLVLDCFAGSGTTLLAAQRHKRRWIGIDSSKLALYATLKRLMKADPPPSFDLLYSQEIDRAAHESNSAVRLVPARVQGTDQETSGALAIEVASSPSLRMNQPGLAFAGRLKNQTFSLQHLPIITQGKQFLVTPSDDVQPGRDSLIIFDIHGNESVIPLIK